jgi:hypothetical protein
MEVLALGIRKSDAERSIGGTPEPELKNAIGKGGFMKRHHHVLGGWIRCELEGAFPQ